MNDIRYWCDKHDIKFDFYRAGLNDGQEIEFNIPENLDHPNAYQWEALTDKAARAIITQALATIPDLLEKDSEVKKSEEKITNKFQELWPEFVKQFSQRN